MDDKIKKTCPSCSQFYHLKFQSPPYKYNLPLFLSCGHSMCENCIQHTVKCLEPVECKICHREMEINQENVTKLKEQKIKVYDLCPINFHMVGELAVGAMMDPGTNSKKIDKEFYVDLESIMEVSDELKGKCVECHQQTSKMCKQCAVHLCHMCFNKTHKNFVVFKNHQLQNIETGDSTNICKTHKDKTLDYYCNDCKKSVCMDCLMVGGDESCKNHKIVSMQEINENLLQEINTHSSKVYEIFKRLTKTAVDIGNLLHNIENDTGTSELQQTMFDIEQHFSKLCSIVQKHKNEVIGTLASLKSAEKESLQKAKNDVTEAIKKSKKVMETINSTLDPDKVKKINLSVLLDDTKQVENIPWYLRKDDSSSELKVAVNENVCELISDYIHLEGNAKHLYKLCSTSELGPDFEIPPAPNAPVYPPEFPKDVRQSNTEIVKEKEPKEPQANVTTKTPKFFTQASNFRSKSASNSSLNSSQSSSSRRSYLTIDAPRPQSKVQQVKPFSESKSPKPLTEGSSDVIYITHIINPNNFYVQRASNQAVVKDMLKQLKNAANFPKPSMNHLAEGKIYLVYNKADKMWQRCRIINIDRSDINNPKIRVFCFDFGSTEQVTLDNLRLISPALMQNPPPLAFNCSLINCEPIAGAWTNDDSFLIQNIIDNKQAVIYIHRVHYTSNNLKLECDLVTFEDEINIARALVFHERAKMPKHKQQFFLPMKTKEMPKVIISNSDYKTQTVEDVYITHIISPDKFFVRKRHSQELYEKLCEDMEAKYDMNSTSGIVYLPEVGGVYAVKTGEGGWARAQVLELAARGRVRVLLLDAGVAQLQHWAALRYIHPEFTTLRALATECHLAGIMPVKKKWSPQSVTLLRKYERSLLQLHVEESRSHGSVGVTLYDNSDTDNPVCINFEMIKHNFAITIGLCNFNQNMNFSMKLQDMISKTPKPPKCSNSKPQVQILKRNASPVNNDDNNLEAKDKGPLRLEVKILHYESPSLIYVSLLHQQKAFFELFEKIQKYYVSNEIPGKNEWKVGDRCCTRCLQSQTWRRAMVVELEENKAKVFYTDFACTETVTTSDLKQLLPEFASMGDAAIKCHLSGIIPAIGEEWPSLTKEYLKELLDAYNRIFITKIGNFKDKSMPIEFWVYHSIEVEALEPNKSEWRCLNKKLIEQGLGIPDKSSSEKDTEASVEGNGEMLSFLNVTGSVQDWLHLEPLPLKPLSTQTKLDNTSSVISTPQHEDQSDTNVMFISDWLPPEPFQSKKFKAMPTYIDNDGIIFLHDVAQHDTLDLIRKALDLRFNAPDPKAKFVKWNVGEPCIALYYLDNRFYRGRVLAVNEEKSVCLIHYIDYGNDEQCSFMNLRKSIALHEIPTQAHKCILDRIVPKKLRWDTQTLDYLHKTIVEKHCTVQVTGETINNITPIELKYDKLVINNHLVEFELADFTDGTLPLIPTFVPPVSGQEELGSTTDSGPDYIVDEDLQSDKVSEDESQSIGPYKSFNWNDVIEAEEISTKFITYPEPNLDKEFKCNIVVINGVETLDLHILYEDDTSVLYEEMYKDIQENAESMPSLSGIFENKACIALFKDDQMWYRASVLQYSETKSQIKVKYVDYGNIDVISLVDAREIDLEWAKLPPAAITVKLHGVKYNHILDANDIFKEYTNSLLDKGPFKAIVIDYQGSVPLVELKNSNDQLVYEHLIEKGILTKILDLK